jgi:hypothetical protein
MYLPSQMMTKSAIKSNEKKLSKDFFDIFSSRQIRHSLIRFRPFFFSSLSIWCSTSTGFELAMKMLKVKFSVKPAMHSMSYPSSPPPSQAKILSRKFSLNIHMSKRITISQYLCSKLNLLNNFSLTYFYISTYRGIM